MRAVSLLFTLFAAGGAIAAGPAAVGSKAPSALSVTLSNDADPAIAGSDVLYTATATGGSGGYTYRWDIDGDGTTDKTTTGNTLIARFNRETQVNASVVVRDGNGSEGSAQHAVSVVAHRVRLQSALGEPVQVCGDGDAVIEPGERWRFDAVLSNAGARSTAADAYTLISKSTSDSIPGAIRDNFGYALTDSTQGGQCSYQFIDIRTQVSALQLTASGSEPANNEGRSGVLDLGFLGGSFNFYGQTISQLVMSTNGYLGTSDATTGADFNNVCGAVPNADNNGKRLQVLHDDLVVSPTGGLRWAAFTECPRPSGIAPSTQACFVFQWNGMGIYAGAGATPIGDFNFQAVIYPQSWQIVYQYQNGIPNNGVGATVGILDPATSQLTASCNQPRVAAPVAFCFYHPRRLPIESGDLTKLRLENPFVASGDLQPGATRPFSSFFSLEPDTACGSRFRVDVAGTADANSGNNLGGTHEFEVGTTGNCNITQNCALSLPPTINLRPGVFFNPRRDGNGLVAHVVPVAGQLPIFFAAWYTGDRNRSPIWYVVQGRLQDNQVVAPILRVTRDLAAPGFAVTRDTVGSARVQLLGAEKILFSYTLDSDPVGGTEILTHGFQGLASSSPNRTGTWFFGQEDGWGQTFDSYVTGGVAREFITTYLYDAAGEPRWVLADGLASDLGNLPTKAFQVHCPSCGWIDFADSERSAGTMRRQFVAPNSGNLTTQFVLPLPMIGTWSRNQVPISILTPVLTEQP